MDEARLRTVYRRVEERLRALAPEALGALVDPGAAYVQEGPAGFGEDRALGRMLARLGVLPRSRPKGNLYRLLERMAQATGRRAAVVRRVLELYCAPTEGVPHAVCGDEPRCEECPLAAECKFFQRTPSITDLPPDQRPRERLLAEGERALTDAELLAILLRSGTEQDTAVGLAQKLLARFGSFRALAGRTEAEMGTIKGVGPAKVAQVRAAVEIGRRAAREEAAQPGQPLAHSGTVFALYSPRLRDHRKETFLVLLLDAKNRVFRETTLSEGSLTASIVHPREVFSEAVRHQAAAILCVHNHPSGDPAPSRHDREITRRLAETGQLLGIQLLDHVIVGDGVYYSFADEGLLPQGRRDDG